MTHTPGPWGVGREEQELKGDPDDPWVVFGPSFYVEISSSNEEADARLIAAAPELLAVCQELAGESCPWCGHDRPYDGCSYHDVYDRARAAIAKATGEEST